LTRGARARDLKRLFYELGAPEASRDRAYETKRLAPDSRYRIGRDHEDNPVVLIETTDVSGAVSLSNFVGRHLRISHGVSCAIREADVELDRGQFSVVACVASDDTLRDRFFDATETILRSLGENPTVEELRRVVAGLIELFRLANQPPQGTIQGLWAELWLMARAREPGLLLDAWHMEPTDAYDFNCGLERLEVKSTGVRVRRHHFSHRQLTPPAGSEAIVASVFVESSGRGPTIASLLEQIRSCVNKPRALMRLEHVVASTLGSDWRSGIELSFDSELASASLEFYQVEDVPAIRSDIPSGVSELRYVSDLSAVDAMTREEMLGHGGLFAAVLPIVS